MGFMVKGDECLGLGSRVSCGIDGSGLRVYSGNLPFEDSRKLPGLGGGFGLRVWGLGFGVWGLGFGVRGSGFGVWVLVSKVQGLGFT